MTAVTGNDSRVTFCLQCGGIVSYWDLPPEGSPLWNDAAWLGNALRRIRDQLTEPCEFGSDGNHIRTTPRARRALCSTGYLTNYAAPK